MHVNKLIRALIMGDTANGIYVPQGFLVSPMIESVIDNHYHEIWTHTD